MALLCKGLLRGNLTSYLKYLVWISAVAKRDSTYVLSGTLCSSRKGALLLNDFDIREYRDPQATHRFRFSLMISSISVIDNKEERMRTR
jgi:hypothetical protein